MTRRVAMTVLSIQSQIVFGAVGNSIAVFVLQLLGHQVFPVPTLLLSNHPGRGPAKGQALDEAHFGALLDGFAATEGFARCQAVLTGYFGTVGQARRAALLIDALKARQDGCIYFCDPVIGDDPKGVYVKPEIAACLRDELVPRADIVTPNAFELGWLTGLPVATRHDLRRAMHELRGLGPREVVATGLRLADTPGDCVEVFALHGDEVLRARTGRFAEAISGAGDLFSALYLARRLAGTPVRQALGQAVAGVRGAILASRAGGVHDIDPVLARGEFATPSSECAVDIL
jgi:pyridoxine kinase